MTRDAVDSDCHLAGANSVRGRYRAAGALPSANHTGSRELLGIMTDTPPVAIVTGASRGIGRAIARQLARDGHAVIVDYRTRDDAAARVVEEIAEQGGAAWALQADVGQLSEHVKLIDAAPTAWGRIDLLVNNAGINSPGPRLSDDFRLLGTAGGMADLTGNGIVDVGDLDLPSSVVRKGDDDADRHFDLNADGRVDEGDRRFFVRVVADSFFGDADMDGVFDSSDMVRVFQSGEYEDLVSSNSTWASGDWNGNGDFESGDMVLAFQSGGYFPGIEDIELSKTAGIPEPGSQVLGLIGLVMAIMMSRSQTKLRPHEAPRGTPLSGRGRWGAGT